MDIFIKRISLTITIDESLFEEAKNHFLLTDDQDFKEVYIMNAIRSEICQNRNDFQNFSFDEVKKRYSEKELSDLVAKSIREEIEDSIGMEC